MPSASALATAGLFALLYAREDRFRSANLSQQGTGSGVQWTDNQLTIEWERVAEGVSALHAEVGEL